MNEQEYAELGIEADFIGDDLYNFTLEFSDSVWVNIINAEGEYLPRCCAVISEIRDELISVLRENGQISCIDLEKIYTSLKYHNCDGVEITKIQESAAKILAMPKPVKFWEIDADDPLKQIMVLREIAHEDFNLENEDLGRDQNLDDPKVAIGILSSSCWNYDFYNLISSEEKEIHKQLALNKIYILVNTLHKKLLDIVETVTGFAVCVNDKIFVLRNNDSAIFSERKVADDLTKYLNKQMLPNEEIHKVRPVEISINGIKFLD